jgi:hypothetical protein
MDYIKKEPIKPSKFKHPLYVKQEQYEMFTLSFRMFRVDQSEIDMYIDSCKKDERYVEIWYTSAFRRDADYIRCLRYLLVEAYGTEYVFDNDEKFKK